MYTPQTTIRGWVNIAAGYHTSSNTRADLDATAANVLVGASPLEFEPWQ